MGTEFEICWAVRGSMAWENHLEISFISRVLMIKSNLFEVWIAKKLT